MQKPAYAGCLGLSSVILAQFTFKMCAVTQNREKINKFLILGVQGRSRSSTLVFSESSSLVLVMKNSMSVPICKHFYAKWGNSGNITTFQGVLLFDARVITLSWTYEIGTWTTIISYYNAQKVCLSVCQPSLAPSLLHGRGPRPRRLSPWALGTCSPPCPPPPSHGRSEGARVDLVGLLSLLILPNLPV